MASKGKHRFAGVVTMLVVGCAGVCGVSAAVVTGSSGDARRASLFELIEQNQGSVALACEAPRDCGLARVCDGGANAGLFCTSNADCPGSTCGAQPLCPNDPSVFPNPGDPVEVRAASMGLKLDGDVADGIAAGAVALVDTVPDEAGTLPGINGDAESPRLPASASDPNGFNIGTSLLLFVPDSDPTDGIDDSFLYVGWDLSDRVDADGLRARQYDSDDNNDATNLAACATDCPTSDTLPESYEVFLQSCTTLDVFDSVVGPDILRLDDPQGIQTVGGADADLLMLNVEVCSFPLSIVPNPGSLNAIAFPTADSVTNLSNSCIDLEVNACGAGNDVEMIIKQVETGGEFGPNAVALPDSAEARENRMALAQLLGSLHAGSSGDLSDEEIANVAQRVSIPDIEVTKKVRCADSGQTTFSAGPIDALIGSNVEYQVTVSNLGNEDLAVTVQDVLVEIGAQDGFASCDITCDSIQAFLTSPSRGLVDEPVNPGTAGGFNLNPDFFVPNCAAPGSFVGSVQNSTSAVMGTLRGTTVARDGAGVCSFTEGDSIVITFKAVVGATDTAQFCGQFVDGDCRNSVSVSATLPGSATVVAEDIAGAIDTDRETVSGADDNSTTVNIVCRGLDFLKEVGFPGDAGSFVTGTTKLAVPTVPAAGNVQIEYRYTATNTGEVDELTAIDDAGLCADITATNASFPGAITLVNCPICPGGSVGPTNVAAGGTLTSSCVLQFNAVGGPDPNAGLRFFLAQDNGDPACNGEAPLTGNEIDDCYRNCASASTSTSDFGNICRPPTEQFTVPSFTTICNRTCALVVVKQVRCLPTCSTAGMDAEDGWVSDPSRLDVLPGACLQYRIVTTNDGDIPVCALEYDDLMSNSGNFQSGPTDVQMPGNSCTNVDIATAFNWDGTPVSCLLSSALQPAQSVTVLFQAIVGANPAQDVSTNDVTVTGAAECPAQREPTFSCPDSSSVSIDIKRCNLTLTKDVTCDDPRGANPTFEADGLADALPGAEIGFRFQLTNTGNVDLTSVDITDVLSCSDWYVAGSVECDIDGTPVTNCVCTSPAGDCDQVSDINGTKTFGACGLANGIPSGGVLTCTLRVKVPADFATVGISPDCTNTVTVQGTSDLCQAPGSNPCPEASASADIDVLVPGIECDKKVCADLDNNGQCDPEFPFADKLVVPNQDQAYPLTIIWQYSLQNTGEVPFASSQIIDPNLVADRDINGLTGTCGLNGAGIADLGPLAVGGAAATVTCSIQFPSEQAWKDFAAKDGNPTGGAPETCYSNDATGVSVVDTTDLCTNGSETVIESNACTAEVCLPPGCVIDVTKQVRCLEDCSTVGLDPDAGWVGTEGTCSNDPDRCCSVNSDCAAGGVCNDASGLVVAPGACLQYRIVVTNTSTDDVSVCALEFDDEMVGKDSFQSGPSSVQLSGGSCSNISFSNAFNWDGVPVSCELSSPLAAGNSLTVLFTSQLRTDAIVDPHNNVTVRGAVSPEGCAGQEPVFTCQDCSSVPVDIQQCSLTVEKDVACDGAAFDPQLVEALPGSIATFRIRMTNTGEVNMPEVLINESLGCNSWFQAGTVTADINGTDVTNCICTNPLGNCDQVGDINGLKDLSACVAGGVAPGQVLTISFDVQVPENFSNMNTAVDCTNRVTIEARTDVCHASGFNPCGSDDDDASINVLVPQIECDKCVCADTDANGTCDTPCLTGLDLQDECIAPFRLQYRWSVRNSGETDLKNVSIEDAAFRSDAAPFVVSCDIPLGGTAVVGDVAKGGTSADFFCTLQFNDDSEFPTFALSDGGDESDYRNTSTTTGTPDVGPNVCPSDVTTTDTCSALVSCGSPDCIPPSREACGPHTKAKFEIWNEFESKFSGTERCIAQWDQELLSEYTEPGTPNHFWRTVLRTDKGKARIDGVESPAVCGADTQNVPLIGVSQKIVLFDGNYDGEIDRTGMSLVGSGTQAGQFRWDIGGGGDGGVPPEELKNPREGDGSTSSALRGGARSYDSQKNPDSDPDFVTTAGDPNPDQNARATISSKGSFVVFPKVEIKWDSSGDVIQDTFLDLTNDYPNSVRVQMYFVNADCCVWLDNAITLTGNQPIYWSALTGDPRFLSPFTELGRGNRDTDPTNVNGRVLRGYVVAWAVDPITGNEISWNHLKGDAVVVNYKEGSAWEYNTWNFRAVSGTTGAPLLAPFGTLDLNGVEYDFAPDTLLLDFYASGATFFTGPNGAATIDTDLTLMAAIKDLRLILPPQQP